MSNTLTMEFPVDLKGCKRERKQLRDGPAQAPLPPGRFPRVARLTALAWRIDELVRTGAVRDYAERARFGRVRLRRG